MEGGIPDSKARNKPQDQTNNEACLENHAIAIHDIEEKHGEVNDSVSAWLLHDVTCNDNVHDGYVNRKHQGNKHETDEL